MESALAMSARWERLETENRLAHRCRIAELLEKTTNLFKEAGKELPEGKAKEAWDGDMKPNLDPGEDKKILLSLS